MLCDTQITERILDGTLLVEPFEKEQVQPASLDLRLHHLIRVPRLQNPMSLDLAYLRKEHTELARIPDGGWEMLPGAFLLASTVEKITLPGDLAGRVEGKSSLGRVGLAVHITAGFIDPGFRGQITLEIANLSPWTIKLDSGMPIAQLCLFPMSRVPERLYGQAGNRYQDQVGPVESRYEMR